MNVEMLKKVRDRIARGRTRQQFAMETWIHLSNGQVDIPDTLSAYREHAQDVKEGHCKTTACIAGWTVIEASKHSLLDLERRGRISGTSYIHEVAGELLGLSWSDTIYLFYGGWSPHRDDSGVPQLRTITKREALDYLDECVAAREIVRR